MSTFFATPAGFQSCRSKLNVTETTIQSFSAPQLGELFLNEPQLYVTTHDLVNNTLDRCVPGLIGHKGFSVSRAETKAGRT